MFVMGRSLLVLALVLIASSVASAQTGGDTRARLHFEAGRSHYENGAYEEAMREFLAAYEFSGRADLLYNLYLTAERMADLDRAFEFLDRYLREGAPSDEQRALLEQRRANLEERRARRQAPDPGQPPDPRPAASTGGDLGPAIAAFAVAGAGLLTFAVFGGLALAEDGSLAQGCGADGSCTDAQLSNLATFDLVADIGWVSAAVAAATGAILLFVFGLPSGDGATPSAMIAPWAAPGAAGLSSRVRF